MKDQLNILIPDRELETSGGKITLKPFKFKQINKAIKIINNYIERFVGAEDNLALIKSLLADNGEAAITDFCELISMCCGASRALIDELGYDEVVNICANILKQNQDFFSQIGKQLNPSEEPVASLTTGES